MPKRLTVWVGLSLVLLCFVCSQTIISHVSALQSPNYRLDESVVGVGDMNQSSSTNYQATNSTGDLSIGNSASGNYQIEAGTKTTPDPALSFAIISANIDFGKFTASTATTTTSTFSVSNYTSYGYVVQIFGSAPTNGSHTITPMTTTGQSEPGKEQFGINLVANTLPLSFGANPNNGQFGFGEIASNYSTSNRYRYVSGESIAQAPKSSGTTIYTISYLVNVAGLTIGGQYTSNQTIIITGTY